MPPGGLDNYVHRIGRTGRAGVKGIAHSFVTKQDFSIQSVGGGGMPDLSSIDPTKLPDALNVNLGTGLKR